MDKQIMRYKIKNVVKTYLGVTFEDRKSNTPTLAKISHPRKDLPPSQRSSLEMTRARRKWRGKDEYDMKETK